MADERSTSPVFGDAGGTSPREGEESTEEAAGAKRAAPAGGRAQSKKRGTTKSLRIGIISGKVDDDCCVAPNIPESHWVSEAAARREEVHSDVAIWWYMKQHFPDVEADLIEPREVSAKRLQSNDINLLLGWDACSAYMEEFPDDRESEYEPGHAERMAELLRAPSSKVWPPGHVQDLVNIKSNYHKRAEECGIPIAPTLYHTCEGASEGDALAILDQVKELGWKKITAKPVPSSWARGIRTWNSAPLHKEAAKPAAERRKKAHALAKPVTALQDFEEYFESFAHPDTRDAETYYGAAAEILVQENISGLQLYPETRCFFYGGEFLYAVANSVHPGGGQKVKITSGPKSADGGSLPAKYWQPAKELGERVQNELLPELRGFKGQKLSKPFPWLTRIDVGMHTGGLNDAERSADWPKGKPKFFLNEIEIVPTYYIAKQFRHQHDFIAIYAKKMVETCAEVVGLANTPQPA